jgi:tripartite-type tricarboxylate transporter receptor subunit TctC
VNFGSGGIGSPQHLAMALFASNAGVTMTHVPYKGASQAAVGVAAGEVPVAFQGLATVATLARGGKLRIIGVTTPAPIAEFPGVPTVATSGLPGFQFNSWFTVMAPAGTPKEIVARLNAEIVKALADPDVRDKLRDQGLTVRGSSPEELAAATRDQLARYGRLIRENNIRAE